MVLALVTLVEGSVWRVVSDAGFLLHLRHSSKPSWFLVLLGCPESLDSVKTEILERQRPHTIDFGVKLVMTDANAPMLLLDQQRRVQHFVQLQCSSAPCSRSFTFLATGMYKFITYSWKTSMFETIGTFQGRK